MERSAQHLDDLRDRHNMPHLIHTILDHYFRELHRIHHKLDSTQRNPTNEAITARDRMWSTVMNIPTTKRQRRQLSYAQRRRGHYTEHEDLIIIQILGPYWTQTIKQYPHKRAWVHYCRTQTTNTLNKFSFPPDPRLRHRQTPTQHNNQNTNSDNNETTMTTTFHQQSQKPRAPGNTGQPTTTVST